MASRVPDAHRSRQSLVAALLDTRFEHQVTPYLVRWVYLGTLTFVAFGEAFSLLWLWALASWIGAAMWLAAPVLLGVGLVLVLAVRIAYERTLAKLGKWSGHSTTQAGGLPMP